MESVAAIDKLGPSAGPSSVVRVVADAAPDAWERAIERLLASPHYGERWGRRWLDLARYADSNGLDENLALASRNLANVLVVEPRYADPLSLVFYKKVLVTKGAIEQLKEMYA